MWLALFATASAVDFDLTVTPPKGPAFDVRLTHLEPGLVPGALLVPWFDGKQARVMFEVTKRKSGWQLGVEISEVRVLADGTWSIIVAKTDTLKLSEEKRTRLELSAGSDEDGAVVQGWAIEANVVAGSDKKAAE